MGRVLITGASAGIGAELARVFAKHGHKLALVARSADKLQALADELKFEFGTDAIVMPADLSTAKGVAGLVAALDKRKEEIDILVNNAGVLEVGAFCDMPTEDVMKLVHGDAAHLGDGDGDSGTLTIKAEILAGRERHHRFGQRRHHDGAVGPR